MIAIEVNSTVYREKIYSELQDVISENQELKVIFYFVKNIRCLEKIFIWISGMEIFSKASSVAFCIYILRECGLFKLLN